MADTWIVFGDPSVQVRTDVPATMEVIHDSFIPNGAETFEVDVTGLPNALCAISADGMLLGKWIFRSNRTCDYPFLLPD